MKKQFGGDLDNVNLYPSQIIFYTTGSLSNIEFKNIIGISLFLQEDEILTHNYFNIRSGKAFLNNDYTAKGTSFKLNDISQLTMNENPNGASKWVLLSEFKNLSSQRVSFKNKSLSQIKLITKITQNTFEYEVYGGCSEFQCSTSRPGYCFSDERGVFCSTNDGDEIPVDGGDGGCVVGMINEGGTNNRVNTYEQLDLKKSYNFRDNFLKKSKLGKEYINYYYNISKISKEKGILKNNFSTHVNFAVETYKVADILEDNATNEIPITESYEKSAKSLISLYRDKSNEKDFQKMLDDIEKDIKKFKGKRKSEIIKELDK